MTAIKLYARARAFICDFTIAPAGAKEGREGESGEEKRLEQIII